MKGENERGRGKEKKKMAEEKDEAKKEKKRSTTDGYLREVDKVFDFDLDFDCVINYSVGHKN